jgi:hypothetical protein
VSRKRSNVGARVCALVSFVVLSATALTPAPALALPAGRAYEMVSPPYKSGYGVGEIFAVAPDGESVAFASQGAFAGAPSDVAGNVYLARRGASGWSTTPLSEPASLVPRATLIDFSSTLTSTLFTGVVGASVGFGEYAGTEEELLLHSTATPDIAANWEVAGGIVLKRTDGKPLKTLVPGASADLCHILIGSTGGPLLPEAEGTSNQIYDLSRGCGGAPSLRLLGLNNEGKPINPHCEALGALHFEKSGKASAFNAISADGSEIFFTVKVDPTSFTCNDVARDQVFVRLGGARTLEVSKPLEETCSEVPCPNAQKRASAFFEGASEDGSRVFFTTTAPLVGEDKDTGNDLYMATIGCPSSEGEGCETAKKEVRSLVQVSHDPTAGEAAEVQGVVRVARDGSHVYFVARGVLSEGANVQGNAPAKGANNLYVYERDARYPEGHVAFIADLLSSDAGLWLSSQPEAQSTSDGSFLVFSTYAQLVKSDTDTAKDVYRYDAPSGALNRVSLGEAGYDANGNNNAFDATIARGTSSALAFEVHEMGTRAISEDGSRIVFTTAERLSEAATNHLVNAYEWHERPGGGEGEVSLVSSGSDEEPVRSVVISPSGRDVFFTTVQGLVPQDTDGQTDVYDARLNGGFPPVPAEPEPCSGDACQGALTSPAPLLVPGSVVQAAGGNFAAPAPATTVKPKAKATPRCSRSKKLSHGKCVKKAKAKKASNNRRIKR